MRIESAPKSPPEGSSQSTKDIYARIESRRAPRPLTALDLALLHNPRIADGWNSLLGAIRGQPVPNVSKSGDSSSTASLDSPQTSAISARTRELIVCRVAILNGADYEWKHHAPLAKEADVPLEDIQNLPCHGFHYSTCAPQQDQSVSVYEERNRHRLSPLDLAVLEYTDSMTKDVKVQDDVVNRLRKMLEEDDEARQDWFDFRDNSAWPVAQRRGQPRELFLQEYGAVYLDSVPQGQIDKKIMEITATVAAYNCVSRFLVALEVGS